MHIVEEIKVIQNQKHMKILYYANVKGTMKALPSLSAPLASSVINNVIIKDSK